MRLPCTPRLGLLLNTLIRGLLCGMNNTLLTERYQDRIVGVLGCFDRIVITGSLPDCCHVDAMRTQLLKRKIMFFDYPDSSIRCATACTRMRRPSPKLRA